MRKSLQQSTWKETKIKKTTVIIPKKRGINIISLSNLHYDNTMRKELCQGKSGGIFWGKKRNFFEKNMPKIVKKIKPDSG
jgi:hypothetical protein